MALYYGEAKPILQQNIQSLGCNLSFQSPLWPCPGSAGLNCCSCLTLLNLSNSASPQPRILFMWKLPTHTSRPNLMKPFFNKAFLDSVRQD